MSFAYIEWRDCLPQIVIALSQQNTSQRCISTAAHWYEQLTTLFAGKKPCTTFRCSLPHLDAKKTRASVHFCCDFSSRFLINPTESVPLTQLCRGLSAPILYARLDKQGSRCWLAHVC